MLLPSSIRQVAMSFLLKDLNHIRLPGYQDCTAFLGMRIAFYHDVEPCYVINWRKSASCRRLSRTSAGGSACVQCTQIC